MDLRTAPVSKILWKLSPPVMLALLIQSIYNIVDSFFIARYMEEGLTALSIIYPIQLLMTALATGTGAGVNLLIARMDGQGEKARQADVVLSGLGLAAVHFALFALLGNALIQGYFHLSSEDALVCTLGIRYSRIIFSGCLGLFAESIATKVLQAKGNMLLPMKAQIAGAMTNVILDPILIFGLGGIPALGISGAAIATVLGQWVAMGITLRGMLRYVPVRGKIRRKTCRHIYRNGAGSIVTQSLYTLYIIGLNLILKGFTEDAVTVLGIYYKIQSFFFIPLLGFQQVLLPVISFHFGAGENRRIREIVKAALKLSCGLMLLATAVFLLIPEQLLRIFSQKPEIISIGVIALRIIALSFVPSGVTIVVTSHLQGIGRIKESLWMIVLRQVLLLVPLAWLLHFLGLEAVWWTFPLTELIAAGCCAALERRQLHYYTVLP